MPLLDEVIMYKDLGIGAISMVIFYAFARSYREDFFKQLQEANKRGEESQKRFMDFLETTFKDNTKTIQELVQAFKDHTRIKDAALLLLEQRHDELKKEMEEKYQYLKKFHE